MAWVNLGRNYDVVLLLNRFGQVMRLVCVLDNHALSSWSQSMTASPALISSKVKLKFLGIQFNSSDWLSLENGTCLS